MFLRRLLRRHWAIVFGLASLLVLLNQGDPVFAADFGDLDAGKAQDIRPQDVISWEAFQAVTSADGTIDAALRMTATKDWKVYVKNLKFSGPSGYSINKISAPPTRTIMDPIENQETQVYDGGEFTINLQGAPTWRQSTFPVTITYVGCTNVICLFPYSQTVDVAMVPPPNSAAQTTATPPEGEPPTMPDDDLQVSLAATLSNGATSLISLFAIVFLGGLLSNLTPCVAPMVPITVRLLARQGHNHYLNACYYALGIIFSYSSLGLVAALSGGLFGSLLASKGFNISFALVMMILGVTMLGFGDLTLLQRLGSQLGSGKPSPHNTILMGVGAGLVAAPCTGPILAALLAYTARNATSIGVSTALLSTYSIGFALPYIALGAAASKVSKWRVPPLTQLAVKLLFAGTMFGLSFYYLRVPFYELAQSMRPYWVNLATGGIAVGLTLSAAILAMPRLHQAKSALIVPTMALGFGLFALSQWATSKSDQADAAPELDWYHDEASAYAAAVRSGKPIFVDMWAEWCEACKKMDITTLANPKVVTALREQWILLKLDFTETSTASDDLQQKYAVQSLPTFVLLPKNADLNHKYAITGYVNETTLMSELMKFIKL